MKKLTLEERALKFMKEHPNYSPYDFSTLERIKRIEKNKLKRAKIERDIMQLRFETKLTLAEIGEKYGISRQRVDQVVKKYRSLK